MTGNFNKGKLTYVKWLALFALLLIATAGGYLWITSGKSESHDIQTLEVAVGDIEENVTAQGKLEPKEYVDVGAQVTGQLQKLYVDIGDNVSAGQLLVEIDPRVYAARVQADEANIKNLRAQLEGQQAQVIFARQQFERNRALMKSRGVSEQDFQSSEFNLKKAVATAASIQAQIEQVQSTLSGDRTNLGYTKIFAPIDGTVVTRTARLGQTLNANQTTPMILQIAKLDAMTVRAQVAEADVMRLTADLPVYFTTLGSGDRRWHGKVRQILPSPEVLNNVVLYNVLVDVDNRDRQLMSGMSTQMFFVLGRADNANLIPLAALGRRLPERDNAVGKAYQVRQVVGQVVTEKIVRIGLLNRRFAEVREGLAAGDRLVGMARPDDKSKDKRKGKGYPTPGVPRL
ncbi:efflux RND transporter periplasmic adaptor subunit [Methylomonas methanica]|uniref:Efflux transporter, RND family, MFP subunit n=1 Tax=Methylomonas methanica (strain DSM 25384 / MC09) TaxID=857087 RepID=G0A3I5_METMM|nr:efflux RND transporter periplasmic adaptor subunit [Methylomonas methanica]AEG00284.1 efflux transporter, RND family, MFP subunit [Methylomonas methanica MC09]